MAQQRDDLILKTLDRLEHKQDKQDGKINEISQDVAVIKTKVGTIETKVGTIETKVGTIETKVETIEKQQDKWDPVISQLNTDVTKINTRENTKAIGLSNRLSITIAVGVVIAAITGFVGSLGGWQSIFELFKSNG